jgi:glycosyltransferase involved in cell wall biosynthesis
MTQSLLTPPDEKTAPLTQGAIPSPRGRVLHLINGDDYSGAERVQDLFGLRLPELGFQVGFACLKPGRFAEARLAQSVPLYDVSMKSRFDLSPVWALARLIRSEGYDLVHTHSVRTALVGRPAAALARVPMIHHMHCQTSTEARQVWRSWINAGVERVSLWGVKGIVAASPTLGRYLKRHRYPDRLVTVVPNGVPGPAELPKRRPPQDRWIVGSVAMFRPRKGTEVLLEAIQRLRAAGIDARLHLVGCFQTDEYEHEVRAHVQRLGLDDAVHFTGFTRDVNAELQKMDLFVLPSVVAEGLPMAVLEAMAVGVPVVGTRVDGVTDAVRDGLDGVLARPADAGDLAAAMARIIRGEVSWTELRTTAHQRQQAMFSDVSMARGVAGVYHRVLNLNPRNGAHAVSG